MKSYIIHSYIRKSSPQGPDTILRPTTLKRSPPSVNIHGGHVQKLMTKIWIHNAKCIKKTYWYDMSSSRYHTKCSAPLCANGATPNSSIMKNERFYCVDCPLEDPSVNLIKLGFHCQPPKRLWYQKSRSSHLLCEKAARVQFQRDVFILMCP